MAIDRRREQEPDVGISQELLVPMLVTNAFLLGVLREGTGDRDYVDTVLLIAIVQANIVPILNAPELGARFSSLRTMPPDDVRRPISISALAASVRLPLETVRRRVLQLQRDDFCRITSEGVRVPAHIVQRHDASLLVNYDLVKGLYTTLRAAGRLQELPAVEAEGDIADVPIRTVARISYDFFLRVLDLLAADAGDLLGALCWISILHNNVRCSPQFFRYPDATFRPVAVSSLAAQLGISEPTIRRRVSKTIKAELCRRVSGGIIVTDSGLRRDQFMELMRMNDAALKRMFRSLHRLGVLTAWGRRP